MAPRAGQKTPPPPPSPNPAPAGHNQGPLTQDDLDDLFIVHLAQARQDNDAVEAANEVLRGVKKKRTRNRVLCRTDGFPLTELDNILADELLPQHEVAEREAQRLRMRALANQPGGSLEPAKDNLLPGFSDSFAKREQDEGYWRGHGFTAGQRGLEADVEKHGVPPEWHQVWLTQWHEGQKRLAKAWETKQRIEGTLPIPPTPAEGVHAEGSAAGEPEGTTEPPTGTSSTTEPTSDTEAGAAVPVADATEAWTENDLPPPADDPTNEPCPDCNAPAGEPCAVDCPSDAVAPAEPVEA